MDEKESGGTPVLVPDVEPQITSSRNILLVMGGFSLLGIALALLLFGGPLLDLFKDETPAELPQIPAANSDLESNPAGNVLAAGDPATEFVLPDLEGNDVSLSEFAGRPLLINFWATWCAPCRIEMPELQNAHDTYQDQGLVVLAVNSQEDEQQVREFIDELGLTFIPLLDSQDMVGRAYGVNGLPSTYFIDKSGVVTAVHKGILSEDQIEAYLKQILP
ncbi:MAG: TlpA family protein disulfide reductase [Candidatus Promineifilaceae bacterium]|jgi:cytochrome c biogenesis protein CcmG/thiol:disulfide interchange protein DsbE